MIEIDIPKGEYKFAQVTMNQYVHVDGKVICNVVKRFEKETKAIGELIADAGNTAQKCGLLPSELLKQRNELREALIEMIEQYAYSGEKKGVPLIHTGGMSALEGAFDVLGLTDPMPITEFENAIKSTEQ